MADLSSGQRDRGQLILVTAFALAAIFLGLAIIVNSAIFTENLATRSENVDSTKALEYRHGVTQFTGEVIGFANENNATTNETIRRNVTDGIRDINDYTGIQQAQRGTGIALELDSSTNGSRIFQSDAGTFENNETTADWTLATDVTRTRAFEINVTTHSTGDFTVAVEDTDSSDEWDLTISNSTVTVDRSGISTESCSVGTVETVDVTAATVNGEVCPALQDTEAGEDLYFAAGIDDEYEINFENADNIEGTYSLVVDNASLDGSTNDNYAEVDGPGSGARVTPAMYSAILDFEYETPEVEYETDVRVAPGEPA
ncbi:hypothetical protein [Halovenus sp. HT40]|uniref:hypothetical protein n=1 Tax=Halovenus sp. HT40 TaxID=3126691 RepID=UPI00300E87DF